MLETALVVYQGEAEPRSFTATPPALKEPLVDVLWPVWALHRILLDLTVSHAMTLHSQN